MIGVRIVLGLFLCLPCVLVAQLNQTWYLDSFCYARCLTEEMQELVNQLHNTCVAETGTNDGAIDDAKKGIFAEDQGFKCYVKCLLAQMAIIDDDDDSVIDVEAMVAVLPEELQGAIPAIRKCGTQKGANACETAWLTSKCYYREDPEQYFMF